MGRKPSISPEQGARLLEAYGRLGNKSAAAREIGVSEDAAARYLAETPKAATPTLASQREIIETAGASLWDTRGALDESYRRILKLADQLKEGVVLVNGEWQTTVSPAVYVQAIKEIREHIKTSMELGKLLIDIDEVRKFQQTVLAVIGDVDNETKQRIIARLREQHALGLVLSRA